MEQEYWSRQLPYQPPPPPPLDRLTLSTAQQYQQILQTHSDQINQSQMDQENLSSLHPREQSWQQRTDFGNANYDPNVTLNMDSTTNDDMSMLIDPRLLLDYPGSWGASEQQQMELDFDKRVEASAAGSTARYPPQHNVVSMNPSAMYSSPTSDATYQQPHSSHGQLAASYIPSPVTPQYMTPTPPSQYAQQFPHTPPPTGPLRGGLSPRAPMFTPALTPSDNNHNHHNHHRPALPGMRVDPPLSPSHLPSYFTHSPNAPYYTPPASSHTGTPTRDPSTSSPSMLRQAFTAQLQSLPPPPPPFQPTSHPPSAPPANYNGLNAGTVPSENISDWTLSNPNPLQGALSPSHLRPNRTTRSSPRTSRKPPHSATPSAAAHSSFACDHPGCSKTFDSKSGLDHHTRYHGPRPNVCSLCDRGFFFMKDLKRHIKTHSPKERHLLCNFVGCEWRFQRRDHLARHARTHEPRAGAAAAAAGSGGERV